MSYIIHYDIAALIILIIIAVHYNLKKTIYTTTTRVYQKLVKITFLPVIFDLISCCTIDRAKDYPMWFNYINVQIYYISFYLVVVVYFIYLWTIINDNQKLNSVGKLLMLPAICATLLNILTPMTKWVYYFDENGKYQIGPFAWIAYGCGIAYVVLIWVYTIVYRKKFSSRQKASVYFHTILAVLALIVQLVSGTIMVLGFAITLSMILMYLSLENPLDYYDGRLDVFNKVAFGEHTSNKISRKEKFQLLAVKVKGIKYISETFGENYEIELLRQVTEYLKEVVGKGDLFYIEHDTFVITGNWGKEQWSSISRDIHKRFAKKFKVDNNSNVGINLYTYMCMLAYPDSVTKGEHIMDMIKYSLIEAMSSTTNEIVYKTEDILLVSRRENRIIQLIRDALIEEKFRVFYQPIYSVKKKKYTSAEALIRLSDEELGFISPDEFIPLAENSGLILEIGEFVFRKVCKFIKTNKLWEKGIEYVDVNLSVIQCMQERLHELLISIMDEYELDYKYINLEITETAASISGKALQNNMEQLIAKGVRFSLDDYGTGYSNMTTLIKYKFYAVKIDKSMLWTAMKDKKAMIALKHTISMVKDMDMKLVVEGVETKEQASLLEELGCDYFQGFYYSKPVAKVIFLQEIEKYNGKE